MEKHSPSEWVAGRIQTLKPEWRPNPDWAKTRLTARLEERPSRRGWIVATAAATVMLAILVAAPQSRALARELWYRILLRSFDAVRVDLSRVPLSVSITSNDVQQTAATLEHAEQLAGFRPMLPPRGLLADSPAQTVVTSPISVRQVVRVRELEAGLAEAGANEVPVPAEWEGVTLQMSIGPLVIAEYNGEVQIVQAKPIELQVPADFPLEKFAEAAFRCAGMSWWQARAMGEKFAANPAWLLDIPEDEVVQIEEVPLRAGGGLLVEDPIEGGGWRVTVLFSTADRIFAVSSGSREQSIRIANSLL
jgi:hypothetical protein